MTEIKRMFYFEYNCLLQLTLDNLLVLFGSIDSDYHKMKSCRKGNGNPNQEIVRGGSNI